jgi:hypothetical protein
MPKKTAHHRYRFHDNIHHIDFRISKAEQLFDTRDPSPFRDRDLDDTFVRSLVNSARELERHGPYKLCLIFEGAAKEKSQAKETIDAIHQYFSYEAEFEQNELRAQRNRGFVILILGLVFLALCTAGAFFVPRAFPGVASQIFAEGLTIIGWVALWEPVSVLLYDWWPQSRKIALYKNLSSIPIDIIFEA